MTDMEKVVRDLRYLKSFGRVSNNPQITEIAEYAIAMLKEQQQQIWELQDQVEFIKDKQKKKFLVDSEGKITPLPDVVRCKDCIHRGKSEKCVLAAISEEKNFPLFMLDNRGEWFCADGKRR